MKARILFLFLALCFAATVFAQYPSRPIKIVVTIPPGGDKLHSAGGLEPFITSPEEFSALIRRDYERFGKLIKEVGIKTD